MAIQNANIAMEIEETLGLPIAALPINHVYFTARTQRFFLICQMFRGSALQQQYKGMRYENRGDLCLITMEDETCAAGRTKSLCSISARRLGAKKIEHVSGGALLAKRYGM